MTTSIRIVLILILQMTLGGAASAQAPGVEAEEAPSEAYAGDAACAGCHAALHPDYDQTIHARALGKGRLEGDRADHGCETCHGPALAHVNEGGGRDSAGLLSFRAKDDDAIRDENAVCLQCHDRGARAQWTSSAHESGGVPCAGCHTVMKNESIRHQLAAESQLETCATCHPLQRAQMRRSAHMPVREGAMDCSSCHEVHGAVADALVRHDTVNDNCLSCHAEKRGPFLWEHAPVVESCLNCHDAHGSVHRAMLKSAQPRLCQQCHVATLHPSQPRAADDHFVISRSCGQCHVSVHGSNHPSGMGLTR